jgi:hypothetical protein
MIDWLRHAHENISECASCAMCQERRIDPYDPEKARKRDRAYADKYPRMLPSETKPDRFGNPFHSDRDQIEFLIWFLWREGFDGTDSALAAVCEAWWMGDQWRDGAPPTIEEARAFVKSRRDS